MSYIEKNTVEGEGITFPQWTVSSSDIVQHITGTFKGTESGALEINLDYDGNGHPICIAIYPSSGPYSGKSTDTYYSTIQRYAIGRYFMIKSDLSSAPTYSEASAQTCSTNVSYKSSTTSASSLTSSGSQSVNCYGVTATQGRDTAVGVANNKKITVYIADASYGFMKNIEYTYHILYKEFGG